MKKNQILRAWRNADEYHALSAEERAALPENPAAGLDSDDEILASVAGGCGPGSVYVHCGSTSAICTPCPPQYCL